MPTAMRHIYPCMIFMLLSLSLAGCDATVHEYPYEVTPPTELIVELSDDRGEMEHYREINYIRASGRSVAAGVTRAGFMPECYYPDDDYCLRFTVELYDDNSPQAIVDRRTVYGEIGSRPPQSSVGFNVTAGQYTVVAWSDYVLRADGSDLVYDVSDLRALHRTELAVDNNYAKEAFTAAKEVTIAPNYRKEPELRTVEMELTRPQGLYRIATTDLEAFLASGRTLDDIEIEVTYRQYVSLGYDALTQSPNMFEPTRTYTSVPRAIIKDSQTLALLAWDYVLVNNTETNVLVDIAVRDKGGKVIARTTDILIPLMRNKETLVTGEFLTTSFGEGGIVIDDKFPDEIKIDI